MTRWLFVLSSPEQAHAEPLPELLARQGHPVTVVATDDFVVDAVVDGRSETLRDAGIEVFFDAVALARRGLQHRVDPVRRRTYDEIAGSLLDEQTTVVWR